LSTSVTNCSPASRSQKLLEPPPPKHSNATETHRKAARMPPYDSESSDDGEDYTETNVLLGYATKQATGDAVSHLGGAPVSRSLTLTWLARLTLTN
jgi:hypothetical protein